MSSDPGYVLPESFVDLLWSFSDLSYVRDSCQVPVTHLLVGLPIGCRGRPWISPGAIRLPDLVNPELA